MERLIINNRECFVGYHTQEYRANELTAPIRCNSKTAWLGIGYYFWTELEFAKFWGEDFKQQTGYYDVYKAVVFVDKCINAVFNEEGYFFFKKKIEETIDHFISNGLTVKLEQIHKFLAEHIWPDLGIEGVIYDDKPTNPYKSDRIYSEIPDLYYKKRIQFVVFKLDNIHTFAPFLEEQKI